MRKARLASRGPDEHYAKGGVFTQVRYNHSGALESLALPTIVASRGPDEYTRSGIQAEWMEPLHSEKPRMPVFVHPEGIEYPPV